MLILKEIMLISALIFFIA